MKRIRITLLAVSAALLVLVAVLAWRALDGLAFERALRHRTVAERTFEEMERALSRFLESEEARPFEDYRFYLAGSGTRSPLARPSELEFVVGAFQIDPDGSVHTPLEPRDPAVARARGDWPAAPEQERAIELVTGLATSAWSAEASATQDRDEEDAAQTAAAMQQAPGTTRAVAGRLAEHELDAVRRDRSEAEKEDATAYELLRSFDRAAESRAERKQKIERAPSSVLYDEAEPRARASRRVGPMAQAAPESAGSAELESHVGLPSAAGRPAEGQADEVAEELAAREKTGVRIALDPMIGRAAGPDHLLLYRTVVVGQRGYRQGLVLDREKLGAWLHREVIASSGLERVASAAFHATGTPAPAASPSAEYAFDHRFAEPFDALTARLHLAALPGVGSPGAIYGLVALLAVIGAAGLLAIHRMVTVAVDFATRRSNFVAAVTHELKTPLTAIRMYGEMLRDGLVDAEGRREEYYGTITDESERLSRLIDNVLEFSRLERGNREMNWTVGPVDPVLEEAVEKLRAHARREGFRIDVAIAPDLPAIRFDRDALLQVLFNLLDNAMKYARGASPRSVSVEAKRHDAGVLISVRDFGPGVSTRHLARIFEPFYRGEDERTRTAKGTGIGLALVRELCERMGAAVSGVNAEGGGFCVRLAFAPADAAA
jgi:signal transduction histidine kinase